MELKNNPQKDKCSYFIENIFRLCKSDSGIASKLKRAASENQAVSSYGILVRAGIDIEKSNQLITHSIVAEIIAKSELESDVGKENLGAVLRLSLEFKKEEGKELNDTRMRRLLSCDTLEELQLVLRSILNFIISRGNIEKLCLSEFLKDLLYFETESAQNRIKKKWAKSFYADSNNKEENEKNER